MTPNKGELFQFGGFVLVPGERLLMRNGEAIPLTPKAFDLLVALVRRGGHLVSKDELLQEVWPGRFVEEVNLSVNVSVVRKALDRDPGGAALIQTVSKGGYRFVAPAAAGHSARASLGPGATRAISANSDAYRAYVEGRYHWSQRSEPELKKAIDDFRHLRSRLCRSLFWYGGFLRGARLSRLCLAGGCVSLGTTARVAGA